MREHDEHEKLRCHPLVPRCLHGTAHVPVNFVTFPESAPSSLLFFTNFVQFYVSTHVGSERTRSLMSKSNCSCKCLRFLTNMIISVPSEKRSKSCVSKRGGRAARAPRCFCALRGDALFVPRPRHERVHQASFERLPCLFAIECLILNDECLLRMSTPHGQIGAIGGSKRWCWPSTTRQDWAS